MRCTLLLFLTLVINIGSAVAQERVPDTQMSQTLVTEIHALRLDLQHTAATIERVQIVIYRLQAQAALVEKAEQHLDQARNECKQAQEQQKLAVIEIERMRKQRSGSGPEQKAAEQMILEFQAQMETWTAHTQQCQVEQFDAENKFRAEQVKMSELENQLVQLDQILVGLSRK